MQFVTHPFNQIVKLFSSIAGAAVLCTSLITATPAEASGWIHVETQGDGSIIKVKPLSNSGRYRKYMYYVSTAEITPTKSLVDCKVRQTQNYKGYWIDIPVGTLGERIYRIICN